MNVTHIDTCLGCYLTDHHNRPGELLLGISVDGSTTYQEVRDELMNELEGIGLDPSEFDYDAAEDAIKDEFSTVSDMSKPFDGRLEVLSDDERETAMEECQAWFLFEWEEYA